VKVSPRQPEVAADGAVEEGPQTRGGVSRAALRGAAWMGFASWTNQAVALATFIVLGRLLAPDDFGLVAAASVVLWLLRVLVDQGFSQALVQRADLTDVHVDTAFWTALGTGIGLALLTFATAPLVADLYSLPELTNVLRALSIVFVFAALDSTQSALLARKMKFRTQAVRRLFASLISGAVAISFAVSGAGVWALVAQTLIYEGLLAVLLWSLASWRPHRRFSRSSFKDLFGFGFRLTLVRILTNVGAYSDNLLVGVFVGVVALGYYVVGFRVVVVINALISLALMQVVLSAFSRLQHDRDLLNAAFYRSTRLAAGISLPVYVGLALVAHPLTVLVFGEKWAPSAPVMQALALAGFIQGQLIFSTQYVVALGRVGNELRWTAGLIGAELIAFAIAVQFGIVAVALSLAIVLFAAWPIRLRLLGAWGGVRLRTYFRPFPSLLAAVLTMAAAVLGVRAAISGVGGATELVVEIVVGAAVYLVALGLFARGELREMWDWARELRGAGESEGGDLQGA
jgi:O-antigen/teichoic acid export membrane protein